MRDPPAPASSALRDRGGQAARRRYPVRQNRGPCRVYPEDDQGAARYYLDQLQALLAVRDTPVGIGTLWRFFDRHRITPKKSAHVSEQNRPDILKRRWKWFEGKLNLDPYRLVFIDVTWTSINMARRAASGERLRASVSHGHWKTTTFVAGMRGTGMMASMVLDGLINRDAFIANVDQVLEPELKPGDLVIMDKLSSHKAPPAQAVGDRLLFLPPYSPGFNPIEQAFSKHKAHLRTAAEHTIHRLWNAISPILDLFTPKDAPTTSPTSDMTQNDRKTL